MSERGESMYDILLNQCNHNAAEHRRKYGWRLYMERPQRIIMRCENCGHIKFIEFPTGKELSEKYAIPCESCKNGIMRVTKY